MSYQPPFSITPVMIDHISKISEKLGRMDELKTMRISPRLRKINRIKTLTGTLQIEGNTLNEEKITALLEGKRIIGSEEEIKEAQGAINAYSLIGELQYDLLEDLLRAHKVLMNGLLPEAGFFRHVNVRVGTHIAPPYDRITLLMKELMDWLQGTDLHPLIVSSIFHYEFEFIHPFTDGNGRMGRLWQTLILYHWKEAFAYLPLESIIKERQEAYYEAIEVSSEHGESTPFIEFMLEAILQTLKITPQVSPQDTPQDEKLQKVLAFCAVPRSRREIQEYLGMKDRKHFKEAVLDVLLADGYLEMTLPEKPQSPKQKYISNILEDEQ